MFQASLGSPVSLRPGLPSQTLSQRRGEFFTCTFLFFTQPHRYRGPHPALGSRPVLGGCPGRPGSCYHLGLTGGEIEAPRAPGKLHLGLALGSGFGVLCCVGVDARPEPGLGGARAGAWLPRSQGHGEAWWFPFRLLGSGAGWGEITSSPDRPPPLASSPLSWPHLAAQARGGRRWGGWPWPCSR